MKLGWTLLFLAPVLLCRAQTQAIVVPESVRTHLQHFREADDLSGWIYEQIQWVAIAPATRSTALIQAVSEAWRHPNTPAEVQAWLDLLTNQGYSLLLGGAIVPSIDAYTAAYEWARQHQELADPEMVLETILKPLGNNYTRLGDYEQALFIHQKSLAIALAGKDNAALAGAYSNIANTCSNMGRPRQALDYCKKGLLTADPHSALFGLLLSEQADACQQLRLVEEARTSIVNSIAVLQKASGGDAGYWLLMAYQQAGDIYSAEPQKVLHYYQQALALQVRLLKQRGAIRQREQAKLFQRLSALFARLHQHAKALHWSDSCLAILLPGRKIGTIMPEELYAENTLADLFYTRAGLAKETDSADAALLLYQLCFATEKKLREALTTGSSREAAVADNRPQYEEALGLAWKAWERTKEEKYEQIILDLMEGSKAQLLFDEIRQQRLSRDRSPRDSLEVRIRLLENAHIYYQKENLSLSRTDSTTASNVRQDQQINWELVQLRKKQAASGEHRAGSEKTGRWSGEGFPADSLRRLLNDGQIGRLFFWGRSALYTLECGREGIHFIECQKLSPNSEDSLRLFVDRWFQQGVNAMLDHPGDYCEQAYGIFRMLFGSHPFAAGKEYILFPDGVLSLLPVEALVTRPDCPPSPADWPFLIRTTSISYAWSLQTLSAQRTGTGVSAGFSGFFLHGDQRGSASLSAVEDEQMQIERAVVKGNWYADSQATTQRFHRALETSAIVHISSHAFIRKNGIDAPHIELYNDPFYLFELQDLVAHPALVMLSACRTGDGRIVTGEGVQSLARAFIAGGCNAVVAGWWNLNDAATARITGDFYAELTRSKGRNAAATLRQAKLDWLNDANVGYIRKLPYFWAGLGYLGNPNPLENGLFGEGHKRQKQGRWWWSLFLLMPVIFFIISVSARGRTEHSQR